MTWDGIHVFSFDPLSRNLTARGLTSHDKGTHDTCSASDYSGATTDFEEESADDDEPALSLPPKAVGQAGKRVAQGRSPSHCVSDAASTCAPSCGLASVQDAASTCPPVTARGAPRAFAAPTTVQDASSKCDRAPMQAGAQPTAGNKAGSLVALADEVGEQCLVDDAASDSASDVLSEELEGTSLRDEPLDTGRCDDALPGSYADGLDAGSQIDATFEGGLAEDPHQGDLQSDATSDFESTADPDESFLPWPLTSDEGHAADCTSPSQGRESLPRPQGGGDHEPTVQVFNYNPPARTASCLEDATSCPAADEIARLRDAGSAAHRQCKYTVARQKYTEALALAHDDDTLLLNRAASLMMLQDWYSALADCLHAVSVRPDCAKAYIRGARCLQHIGELQRAVDVLNRGIAAVKPAVRRLLEEQRASVDALRLKQVEVEGDLTPELHGKPAGLRALMTVREIYGDIPSARAQTLLLRALIQSRAALGVRPRGHRGHQILDLSLAVLDMRKGAEGEPLSEAWYWRGCALLLTGNRYSARNALKRSGSAPALALLDRMQQADQLKDEGNKLFAARRWDEAADAYESARKVSDADAELLAVLHTNTAACFRKLSDRAEEAMQHAEAAIQVHPTCAKAYFRRGVCHFDTGRWALSLRDFHRAEEMTPNFQGLDTWIMRAQHAVLEGPGRKNHYKALGLLCDCDGDDIKKRYRQLARECHPDKLQNAGPTERQAAEARFKEVNEAHEILGNAARRHEYDFGSRAFSCRY